jgi:hypothetical protein
MADTIETDVAQLKACRDDFQTLVRDRRNAARAELAEADRMKPIIAGSDNEAISRLQARAADAGTSPALKQYINGQLAYHAAVKADQAAEA